MSKLTTSNNRSDLGYLTYPYSSNIKFESGTCVREEKYVKDLSAFKNTSGGRYFIMDLKDRYTMAENFNNYADACTWAENDLEDDGINQRYGICYIDAVAVGKSGGFTTTIRGELE